MQSDLEMIKFSASSVWSMDGRTKHRTRTDVPPVRGAGAGGPGRVLENPSPFARRQLLHMSMRMQTINVTNWLNLIARSNVSCRIGSKTPANESVREELAMTQTLNP